MARYKNITRVAAVGYALKYWWNVVKNYDGLVYDQDFFDIISYNLDRDEVASIITGNFREKELKPLKEAKSDKLELDRDCIGFMLKRIWNEKPLRKGCRDVLRIMRDRIRRKLVAREEDVRFDRRFRALCKFMDIVSCAVLRFCSCNSSSIRLFWYACQKSSRFARNWSSS